MKTFHAVLFSLSLSLSLCGPAFALQVGDGQYAGDYNNVNFDTSQNKFNKISAADSMAIGTIVSWSQATEPDDSWLECDGRIVDAVKYPQLYTMMTRTPNYKNLFLRAGDASNVGTKADDSIKNHNVYIAPHTHIFDGRLVSTAVSGKAEGQIYQKVNASGSIGNYVDGYHSSPLERACGGCSGTPLMSGNLSSINTNAAASNLSDAKVNNGSVTGSNTQISQTGIYTGSTETAPKHVMTRYFIKAR